MARPPTHLSLGRAGIAIFAVSILNYSNMSKFIELTKFSQKEEPSTYYVNVDSIDVFRKIGSYTAIELSGGKSISVKESPESIICRIRATSENPSLP